MQIIDPTESIGSNDVNYNNFLFKFNCSLKIKISFEWVDLGEVHLYAWFQMTLSVAGSQSDISIHDKWIQWLRFVCFPKMVQWTNDKLAPPSLSSVSLRLVSIDEYHASYAKLKEKYFDLLVEQWKTESTNPEKFIHEVRIFRTSILTSNFWLWSKFFKKYFDTTGSIKDQNWSKFNQNRNEMTHFDQFRKTPAFYQLLSLRRFDHAMKLIMLKLNRSC